MEVLAKFLQQKNVIDPRTGKSLSKITRMNEMYDIICNNCYEKKYTKTDRLIAADLIKQIIEED